MRPVGLLTGIGVERGVGSWGALGATRQIKLSVGESLFRPSQRPLLAAARRVRACALPYTNEILECFLSYIILIGFANCILYGGHRLAFWRGAEHRDYWPQNIRLCFAFSCFDGLEGGIWTRLLKKSLFVFYSIFAIFKPYPRRIVYFWRRFIIVMLAVIFGLFLDILESNLHRKLKGLKIATFACS